MHFKTTLRSSSILLVEDEESSSLSWDSDRKVLSFTVAGKLGFYHRNDEKRFLTLGYDAPPKHDLLNGVLSTAGRKQQQQQQQQQDVTMTTTADDHDGDKEEVRDLQQQQQLQQQPEVIIPLQQLLQQRDDSSSSSSSYHQQKQKQLRQQQQQQSSRGAILDDIYDDAAEDETMKMDLLSADEARTDTVGLFPMKLHKLLEAAHNNGHDDIVTWLPDGKAFKILDRTRFIEELMPEYFGSLKFRSFQRSLNFWNFDVTNRPGPHKGEIYHPLFRRDNPTLCEQMKREKIKNPPSTTTTTSPTVNPFSSYEEVEHQLLQQEPQAAAAAAAEGDDDVTPPLSLSSDHLELDDGGVSAPSQQPPAHHEQEQEPVEAAAVAAAADGDDDVTPLSSLSSDHLELADGGVSAPDHLELADGGVSAPSQPPIHHEPMIVPPRPLQQPQQEQEPVAAAAEEEDDEVSSTPSLSSDDLVLADGSNKPMIPPSPLPVILYDILDYAESYGFNHIISWSKKHGGKSFTIYDQSRFENEIFPVFSKFKLRSFEESMKKWGFTSHQDECGRGITWSNYPIFQRGQPNFWPQLCQSLQNKTKTYRSGKKWKRSGMMAGMMDIIGQKKPPAVIGGGRLRIQRHSCPTTPASTLAATCAKVGEEEKRMKEMPIPTPATFNGPMNEMPSSSTSEEKPPQLLVETSVETMAAAAAFNNYLAAPSPTSFLDNSVRSVASGLDNSLRSVASIGLDNSLRSAASIGLPDANKTIAALKKRHSGTSATSEEELSSVVNAAASRNSASPSPPSFLDNRLRSASGALVTNEAIAALMRHSGTPATSSQNKLPAATKLSGFDTSRAILALKVSRKPITHTKNTSGMDASKTLAALRKHWGNESSKVAAEATKNSGLDASKTYAAPKKRKDTANSGLDTSKALAALKKRVDTAFDELGVSKRRPFVKKRKDTVNDAWDATCKTYTDALKKREDTANDEMGASKTRRILENRKDTVNDEWDATSNAYADALKRGRERVTISPSSSSQKPSTPANDGFDASKRIVSLKRSRESGTSSIASLKRRRDSSQSWWSQKPSTASNDGFDASKKIVSLKSSRESGTSSIASLKRPRDSSQSSSSQKPSTASNDGVDASKRIAYLIGTSVDSRRNDSGTTTVDSRRRDSGTTSVDSRTRGSGTTSVDPTSVDTRNRIIKGGVDASKTIDALKKNMYARSGENECRQKTGHFISALRSNLAESSSMHRSAAATTNSLRRVSPPIASLQKGIPLILGHPPVIHTGGGGGGGNGIGGSNTTNTTIFNVVVNNHHLPPQRQALPSLLVPTNTTIRTKKKKRSSKYRGGIIKRKVESGVKYKMMGTTRYRNASGAAKTAVVDLTKYGGK